MIRLCRMFDAVPPEAFGLYRRCRHKVKAAQAVGITGKALRIHDMKRGCVDIRMPVDSRHPTQKGLANNV